MKILDKVNRKIYHSKKYGDFILLDKGSVIDKNNSRIIYMNIFFSDMYGLLYAPYNSDDENMKDLYRLMLMDECDLWKRLIIANNPLTIKNRQLDVMYDISNNKTFFDNIALCLKYDIDWVTGNSTADAELFDYSRIYKNLSITHSEFNTDLGRPFKYSSSQQLTCKFIFNDTLVTIPLVPSEYISSGATPLKLFILSLIRTIEPQTQICITNGLLGGVSALSNINDIQLSGDKDIYMFTQENDNTGHGYRSNINIKNNPKYTNKRRCNKCKSSLISLICSKCGHINIQPN